MNKRKAHGQESTDRGYVHAKWRRKAAATSNCFAARLTLFLTKPSGVGILSCEVRAWDERQWPCRARKAPTSAPCGESAMLQTDKKSNLGGWPTKKMLINGVRSRYVYENK